METNAKAEGDLKEACAFEGSMQVWSPHSSERLETGNLQKDFSSIVKEFCLKSTVDKGAIS